MGRWSRHVLDVLRGRQTGLRTALTGAVAAVATSAMITAVVLQTAAAVSDNSASPATAEPAKACLAGDQPHTFYVMVTECRENLTSISGTVAVPKPLPALTGCATHSNAQLTLQEFLPNGGTNAIEVSSSAFGAAGLVIGWFILGFAVYATLFAAAGSLVTMQSETVWTVSLRAVIQYFVPAASSGFVVEVKV